MGEGHMEWARIENLLTRRETWYLGIIIVIFYRKKSS
jgi:hypothetical protein